MTKLKQLIPFLAIILIQIIINKTNLRADTIELTLRSNEQIRKIEIEPEKMAIIVVDMWDSHTCSTMLEKVEELIPLMNETLEAARNLGIQVIFAPSRCNIAEKWAGKPQRTKVEVIKDYTLPKSNGFVPEIWQRWQSSCMCPVIGKDENTKEPIYNCKKIPKKSNRDQHPDLIVKETDMFLEAGVPQERKEELGVGASINTWGEAAQQELYNICMEKGITHLLYMGVATNMCIVNREFAMVQVKRMGFNPILVRDLTHAMTFNGYNPETKKLDPDFTPEIGTELSIKDIEQYIEPSISAKQLLSAARVNDPNQ